MGVKKETNPRLKQSIRVFFSRGIIVKLCFGIILLYILIVIFAPVLTKYSPTQQSLKEPMLGMSREHPLGTDQLGRDVLTRILYGARISFIASLISSIVAATVGSLLGMAAGYSGGWLAQIIMRLTDAQLSMPQLVVTMVLASVFGTGEYAIGFVIGLSMLPTYIRMVNGLVQSIKQNDYIVAATLIGRSNLKILLQHLLPNCIPTIIVLFTMNLGRAIMTEAGLSFLGIGITPPNPAWGGMVSEGYKYLLVNPSLAIAPGICLVLVVIAFNIVGDSLRDALDPRLKGTL